jgi:hypothetical protein
MGAAVLLSDKVFVYLFFEDTRSRAGRIVVSRCGVKPQKTMKPFGRNPNKKHQPIGIKP